MDRVPQTEQLHCSELVLDQFHGFRWTLGTDFSGDYGFLHHGGMVGYRILLCCSFFHIRLQLSLVSVPTLVAYCCRPAILTDLPWLSCCIQLVGCWLVLVLQQQSLNLWREFNTQQDLGSELVAKWFWGFETEYNPLSFFCSTAVFLRKWSPGNQSSCCSRFQNMGFLQKLWREYFGV